MKKQIQNILDFGPPTGGSELFGIWYLVLGACGGFGACQAFGTCLAFGA